MSDVNLDKVKDTLKKVENEVKAVWEIDGISVYVKNIQINDGEVEVDWFTFHPDPNLNKLGSKVENLAKQLIGYKTCSSTPFSRILSRMKNFFV